MSLSTIRDTAASVCASLDSITILKVHDTAPLDMGCCNSVAFGKRKREEDGFYTGLDANDTGDDSSHGIVAVAKPRARRRQQGPFVPTDGMRALARKLGGITNEKDTLEAMRSNTNKTGFKFVVKDSRRQTTLFRGLLDSKNGQHALRGCHTLEEAAMSVVEFLRNVL